MFQRGFRPFHAVWIDTYNKQFGGGIIYTILSGVSSRNHYYVAVELWLTVPSSSITAPRKPKHTDVNMATGEGADTAISITAPVRGRGAIR